MTQQSLDNLVREIREDLRTLPATQRLYEEVPESLNEFPAVVVSATSGTCWIETHDTGRGTATLMCLHAIRIEIHVPRKDLPREMELMTSLANDAMVWLYSGFRRDQFGGTMIVPGDPRTANNATAPFDYSIGPAEWAGQQTTAWMCDFAVTTVQETN